MLVSQVDHIRTYAASYLTVVIKKLLDTVPKAIMMLLIKDCQNFLHGELLAQLLTSGKLVNIVFGKN
jgi:hypothetical protein